MSLDLQLLSEALTSLAQRSQLPAAVITVDLFGRPCLYDSIRPIAERYEIPVIVDAAVALDAKSRDEDARTEEFLDTYPFDYKILFKDAASAASQPASRALAPCAHTLKVGRLATI